MLRLGVVGTGHRGRAHLGCLVKMTDAKVAAICDPSAQALAKASAEFGVPGTFTDLNAFLDQDLDAVVIAVPAHLNGSVTMRVLASGKPTLAEKPPGLTTKEARELAAAARRSGAMCMVGLNRRFHPIISEAVEIVRQNGPIFQIVAEFHKSMTEAIRVGAFPPYLLDSIIYETAIHSIDLVRALAGSDVASVHSIVRRAASPYRDVHAALVEFENGCVAQITVNYTTDARLERYEIHGKDVSAYLEGVKEAKIFANGALEVIARDTDSGLYNQNRYFLDHVTSGQPIGAPASDLDDAVKTMELIDAIYAGERTEAAAPVRVRAG